MEQKENQRIRLTRKLLTDAFMNMLQEQPIHAISIRDLCEKAGINRTTFYHHYGSQYDLLNDISNRFLAQIAHQLSTADAENQESVQERVALVFHYLEDNLSTAIIISFFLCYLQYFSISSISLTISMSISMPNISNATESATQNVSA